jgi:ATP-binding cassette, subfamily B, bacterial
MSYPTALPESLKSLIQQIFPRAEILLAVFADLQEDGRFGERWLALAADRLLVLAPEGDTGKILHNLPLFEAAPLSIEPLAGGSVLQACANGGKVDLLYFTPSLAKQLAGVCDRLNALAEGRSLAREPLPRQTGRCPKCQLPLGDGTGVCPRCFNKGAAFWRLLHWISPYRSAGITLSLLVLSGTLLKLLPPYLTKLLVDDVLVPRRPALLLRLVIALAGGILLNELLAIWRDRVAAWISCRAAFDLRAALYQSIQWLSLRYFDRHPTGAIISRLTQDTAGVQQFIAKELPWVAINLLTVIGVAVALFIINPLLALIALLPSPLVGLLLAFSRRRLYLSYRHYWQGWARFHNLLNDAFRRLKIIKTFSQQPVEIERFRVRNQNVFETALRAEQSYAGFTRLIAIAAGVSAFLLWYFGGRQIIGGGSLTIGGLIAFLAYAALLYGPLEQLFQTAQSSSKALSAVERIFEVLDNENDLEPGPEDCGLENLRGEIEFRRVSFGYDKAHPVLKDISFRVEAGEMLGLVGKSGVGKTTLINLLCGFYQPDVGEILIDGKALSGLNIAAYRRCLGAVLQEPFIFSGTIAENIAYGRPGAASEVIIRAAKLANAHDFILQRPDGYDEQVGENGGRLSGGEKQRICIARAILHDPKILILDEATANVDLETEDLIQQAIARLIVGRTTFAIAHRLSTLRNADKILVLKAGRIAEIGSHRELFEKKGEYHRLLELHYKTSQVTAID